MSNPSRSTSRWGRVPAWWLLHPDVDADCFCVLAALATYADEHGVCTPSQATLAQHLRRSRPWVNRVVAQLAAAGLLDKTARARGNGGTTSCLYRLRAMPPDLEIYDGESSNASSTPHVGLDGVTAKDLADVDVTGSVPQADIPRQAGDTNHLHLEQNNTPAARTPARDADMDVPPDWEPGEADVAEALRLRPNADLSTHTARFRARCRARGYRFRAGYLGDAWLAWLLEDYKAPASGHGTGHQMPASGPPHYRSETARRPSPPSTALRFAAWAAAATLPAAVSTQPASPWS